MDRYIRAVRTMRIHRTLKPVLVAALLLGAMLTALPASASAATSSNGNVVVQLTSSTPCQDVVFLGLRGSGETANQGQWGMGDPVTAVYGSFLASVKNRHVAATGVDYASAQVPLVANPLSILVPAAWSGYFASIDSGVNAAEATLISRVNRCPQEHYVVAGYSQGAMAVHRMLFDLMRAPIGGTEDKILPRIDAVATVGDGDRVGGDDVVTLGTSPNGSTDDGVAQHLASGATYTSTTMHASTVGFELNKHWYQVCDQYDIVCDFGASSALQKWKGLKVHTKSYTSSNSAVTSAGQSLGQVAMTDNPLHVTFIGGSATVGTSYSGGFTQDGGFDITQFGWTTGSLPPGLSFSGMAGFSGTPTQAGAWTFGFVAKDRGGQTFNGTATIVVAPAAQPYAMTVRMVADPVPPQWSAVGYGAKFHMLVKNTGTQKIAVYVTDANVCSIQTETYGTTGQPPADWSYVSPGEEWAWDCWHTLTAADISQGFYTDSDGALAASDASNVANTVVIPTITAQVQQPVPVQMLSMEVTGQAVTRYITDWTMTLTNTGNIAVTPTALSSSLCGAVSLPTGPIAPGQSVQATCTSTVTESYIAGNMGDIRNSVSETAWDSVNQPYSTSASTVVVALS